MKFMKKISAVLLSLCLVIPCFSIVAQAADGKISFTDPETKVGDMVEVKCVARSTGGSIGDMEIQLTYDSAYLRFESGDGVEAADGTLTYKGSGSSSEASFTMEFQALQEGETKITVSSANISGNGGKTLSLTEGNSTVKIGEGDPSKIKEESGETAAPAAGDKTVEVNGVSYVLTDEFADADIPSGYSRTTVSLDGEDRQMVVNEAGSVTLGYLKDGEGLGEFFLYNTENATFAPYEEISISDTTSIIVLSDTSKVKLPKNYQEAKLTLNEKEFPVWQDSTSDRFYVIYAMNNSGESGYYQYDTVEGTYQKLDNPQEKAAEEKKDSSMMGKIRNFLEKHLSLVILIVGLGSILILILIIVLGVKLRHRNDELDELYEEYGIDDEEEEEEELPPKKEKKKSGLFGRRSKEDDFEDFDDYEDDDYEDEDDYDDYEEDEDESKFSTVDLSNVATEDDVFSGYSERDELTIDDLEDLLGEAPKKKRGQQEDKDAFKVDFIDLD